MTGVTPRGIRYPDGASKAKNLGPELQQFAEDIDAFLLPGNPHFAELIREAVDDALAALEIRPARSVHLEGGEWVYDGPEGAAATHYLLPDHDGEWTVRATVWPTPAATPELTW